MKLVFRAREAAPMGAAARASDSVATDAELLTGPTVTPRAGYGVDSRLNAVLSSARPRADPPGGMRAARSRGRRDPLGRVAVGAGVDAMARRAEAGIGPGLVGVSRDESGAMQPRQGDFVEREPRGQRRNGAGAMAARARAFAVAARAQVARARRPHAVLADEIAVVHEVIRRRAALGADIDVATIAVAQGPLVAVLVATEAARHRRQNRVRRLFGDFDVATNAVAARRAHVPSMVETKVLARELHPLAHVDRPVAASARALVVRLGVAASARRVGRKRCGSAGPLDARPRVAGHAIDAPQHVGAMLEAMRRLFRANPEDPGARNEGDCGDPKGKRADPHGMSKVRERRTRASAS